MFPPTQLSYERPQRDKGNITDGTTDCEGHWNEATQYIEPMENMKAPTLRRGRTERSKQNGHGQVRREIAEYCK